MYPLFFFAFTLIELIIVLAIIAVLVILLLPKILSGKKSLDCIKLAKEIKAELLVAEQTAKKLYEGDSSVTDAQLNKQLESVTEKLKKLKDECGGDDHSSILTQISALTTQLKLYAGGDVPPPEKTILDNFIGLPNDLKETLTK